MSVKYMRIRSEANSSYVELSVIDVERDRYPSMEVHVDVVDAGTFGEIRATVRSIWIALDDYDAFLVQLETCERIRRGAAVLTSMSPGEFELRLEAVDPLGHFMLSYRITTSKTVRAGRGDIVVEGAFDLDSSMVLGLIEEFRCLVME